MANAENAGNPWSTEGEWYRGQLHCHSTGSDGHLSPQEVVDRYAARGYRFLAITDHNALTPIAGLDARGLCLIPATEWTAPGGELGTSYHVVGLGVERLPAPGVLATEVASFFRAQGATVVVAHPHWSGLTVADVLRVEDAHAVEIHNAATVLDSRKGDAQAHWDELLHRGSRLWGVAADDMHWGNVDLGLSWVQVRAEECRPRAILDALAAGRFYASTGPELHEVRLSGREVTVHCSPCLAIYCLSFGPRNRFAHDFDAATGTLRPITEATFTLSGAEEYVRVEVVDAHRQVAWSNPLWVQESS